MVLHHKSKEDLLIEESLLIKIKMRRMREDLDAGISAEDIMSDSSLHFSLSSVSNMPICSSGSSADNPFAILFALCVCELMWHGVPVFHTKAV